MFFSSQGFLPVENLPSSFNLVSEIFVADRYRLIDADQGPDPDPTYGYYFDADPNLDPDPDPTPSKFW